MKKLQKKNILNCKTNVFKPKKTIIKKKYVPKCMVCGVNM